MRVSRRDFSRHFGMAATSACLGLKLTCPRIPDIYESPPIFYDRDGLIVHRGWDGGDTAQRERWYWTNISA
jgi:hypothetical protein